MYCSCATHSLHNKVFENNSNQTNKWPCNLLQLKLYRFVQYLKNQNGESFVYWKAICFFFPISALWEHYLYCSAFQVFGIKESFYSFKILKRQGMTFTTKYKWQKLNKMPSALNIYIVCMNVKIGVAAVNNTFFIKGSLRITRKLGKIRDCFCCCSNMLLLLYVVFFLEYS